MRAEAELVHGHVQLAVVEVLRLRVSIQQQITMYKASTTSIGYILAITGYTFDQYITDYTFSLSLAAAFTTF